MEEARSGPRAFLCPLANGELGHVEHLQAAHTAPMLCLIESKTFLIDQDRERAVPAVNDEPARQQQIGLRGARDSDRMTNDRTLNRLLG